MVVEADVNFAYGLIFYTNKVFRSTAQLKSYQQLYRFYDIGQAHLLLILSTFLNHKQIKQKSLYKAQQSR